MTAFVFRRTARSASIVIAWLVWSTQTVSAAAPAPALLAPAHGASVIVPTFSWTSTAEGTTNGRIRITVVLTMSFGDANNSRPLPP